MPVPGKTGTLFLARNPPCRMLESERAHLLRSGSDEDDALPRTGFCESGVLTQKSVAGMDRLRTGGASRLQNRIHRKIALRWRRRPYQHCFVRALHVQRVPVRLRVDRHRGHAHAPQRANDADGNRAPIGDQDLTQHRSSAASQIKTSTGVGSYPLQGLFSCGQLLIIDQNVGLRAHFHIFARLGNPVFESLTCILRPGEFYREDSRRHGLA